MSTFTTDEIKALDKAGNAVAKAVWMGKHGPSDGPLPDEGQIDKVRAFIKQKYEQKRWYVEGGAAERRRRRPPSSP